MEHLGRYIFGIPPIIELESEPRERRRRNEALNFGILPASGCSHSINLRLNLRKMRRTIVGESMDAESKQLPITPLCDFVGKQQRRSSFRTWSCLRSDSTKNGWKTLETKRKPEAKMQNTLVYILHVGVIL